VRRNVCVCVARVPIVACVAACTRTSARAARGGLGGLETFYYETLRHNVLFMQNVLFAAHC